METRRGNRASANRLKGARLCIVMACADMSEADQVGRLLSEVNSGCLITYRRAEDIIYSSPAGKVVLVILATDDTPVGIGRMLKWLRHRWPGCPITVIGDVGSGDYELAVREGGAFYLTRPVEPQHWSDILAHALGGQDKDGFEGRFPRTGTGFAAGRSGKKK